MKSEIDDLKSRVEILLAAEEVQPYAETIKDQLDKAEIMYRFHEEHSCRNYYGAVGEIMQELADEYHVSVKTVEKIVYPLT